MYPFRLPRRRFLSGCIASVAIGAFSMEITAQPQPSSLIIVSRSGHTMHAAKYLSRTIGAMLLTLRPQPPYPDSYQETIALYQEQNRTHAWPQVTLYPEQDWSEYRRIFLGSPTWSGGLSLPVKQWLSQWDLRGRQLCLFTTHGGSGVAHTLSDLRELAPASDVPDSVAFYGRPLQEEMQEVFSAWLNRL